VFGRGGFVEGLGDEEVFFRIAPYVRDLVGLARSTRVASDPMPIRGLAALAARLAETAALARVATRLTSGNVATPLGKEMTAGISSALAAELEEYCGTPPRPHHVAQAGLVVALLAAELEANDPAKAVLVAQLGRLAENRGAG
jgi:hypothetical protein